MPCVLSYLSFRLVQTGLRVDALLPMHDLSIIITPEASEVSVWSVAHMLPGIERDDSTRLSLSLAKFFGL